MSFGARLTEMRKLKALTQEGLGKGLGTDGKDASKAVVYGWEKDQHFPRVDQLVLICDKLGCTSDYLLFGRLDGERLSPEILALAQQVDAIPSPERERVLMLIRQVIGLAQESVNKAKAVTEKDISSPVDSHLHQVRSRTA